MAIYGVSYYGVGYYGLASPLTFDVSPFVATPMGYGSVQLSWVTPSGTWNQIQLLRNAYGYPTSINEGTLLTSGTDSAPPTSFVDQNLKPGRFYYYSIFVYDNVNGRWALAGTAIALVTTDYASADRLWSFLPGWYREADSDYIPGGQVTGPLYRFMQLFGYQVDRIRSEEESLRLLSNPNYISGGLLPFMAENLGLVTEPEIGYRQLRILLKNAVHLYKTKGAKTGIEGAVSAFSGYGAEVLPGVNLMLDTDDSSFESSIGRWGGQNLLSTQQYSVEAAVGAEWVSRANCTVASSTAQAFVGTHSLLLTASSAANMSAQTPGGVSGFAVRPNRPYTATALLRAATTGRNCHLDFEWFDAQGVSLGTAAGSTTADVTTGFTTITSTKTSPALAAFGRVIVAVDAPANTEAHYADAIQVALGGVTVINATLARATSLTPQNGTGYLSVSTVVAGTDPKIRFSSDGVGDLTGIPVVAGDQCTASAYFQTAATARSARLYIDWYDALGVLLSTSTVGSSATDTAGSWARATVTATAPANTRFAGVTAEIVSAAAGEVHNIDSVQFEIAASASAFQPARQVQIYATAPRINLCTNPNFETNASAWAANGTPVTLAQSAAQAYATSPAYGANSLRLTATSAATIDALHDAGEVVVPGTVYTLSGYLRAATVGRNCQAKILWYDDALATISTSTGTLVADVTTGWVRAICTGVAPDNAAGMKLIFEVVSPANAEQHYLDAVLCEASGSAQPYFDGGVSPSSDYYWEGTAQLSRSYYYFRRDIRTTRLNSVIPDFLPQGTPFNLIYSQLVPA